MQLVEQSEFAPKTLLIIEDNPSDVTHYLRLLEESGIVFDSVQIVDRITEGRKAIQKSAPACCLLDNYLPDGSAEDLLSSIGDDDSAICPVIVVTGQEDATTAVNLMHTGAQDYLIKQHLDAHLLQRAIHGAIKTWQLQRQLSHLALYDSLTGLANRALFIDRLSQIYGESKRYLRSFALIYLDLDRFKLVNDTYGHEAGDEVLKEVSLRIRATIRESDTAARLGGDEFAIILPNINEAKVNYVAYKLVAALTFQLKWKGAHIATTPSIGLSTWPGSANSCQELMQEADLALYRAKHSGRAQFSTFGRNLEQEMKKKELLSRALPRAILNQDLKIAWQPIYDTFSSTIHSVEALVRWHFQGQWVSPTRIVELVLEKQLAELYHQWLFFEAMTQIKQWNGINKSLKLAVNIPANLCHDAKFTQSILDASTTCGVAPENVIVEITETHLMRYPEETRKHLVRLSQSGVEIAIDDFGTGYSSMQYLASLPCKSLKIDQGFFLTLEKNKRNRKIIEAITALAHRLDLKVVAEGIETKKLLESAKSFGCDYVQGYWLGAPVIDESDFLTLCSASKKRGLNIVKKQSAL